MRVSRYINREYQNDSVHFHEYSSETRANEEQYARVEVETPNGNV